MRHHIIPDIIMALDNARILITGGCGQVGLAITQHLKAYHPNSEIHILDLQTPPPASSRFVNDVTYFRGDITDSTTIADIFSNVKPQVVFHTAGLIPQIAERLGLNNEAGFAKINVDGTRNVLDESQKVGTVRAFVFTSSSDVVKGDSWGDLRGVDERCPIPKKFDGPYAKSKALAESLVLTASSPTFPTTALRTHAVFSANDTNLLPLMLAAPRNIHLGSGKNLYDFTYAPNLALAHVLAASNLLTIQPAEASNTSSAAGKPFFVTNAEPCQFRTFLTAVWKAYDGDEDGVKDLAKGMSIPKHVALPLVWMSERASKISKKKPTLTTRDLGDSLAERFFDNTCAKEVFQYVPKVKLADAIKDAVYGYKMVQMQKGNSSEEDTSTEFLKV